MDFKTYLDEFKNVLDDIDEGAVGQVAELLAQARAEGRFVFVVGNGGSGANASHFCEDLAKGTLSDFEGQKRLKVLSLTDNTPAILAWGNDEGYDRIFIEQLRTYASAGDILVAISGSGNSPNILTAVEWAKENGLTTVGLTGFGGGKLRGMVDHCLHIPKNDMGMAEGAHAVIFHYYMKMLTIRFAREDGVTVNPSCV